MFPALPNAGKEGTGEAVRGNDFYLLLADYRRIELAKTDEIAAQRATEVVDAAWPLFPVFIPGNCQNSVMPRYDGPCSPIRDYVSVNTTKFWVLQAQSVTVLLFKRLILFHMPMAAAIAHGMEFGFVPNTIDKPKESSLVAETVLTLRL